MRSIIEEIAEAEAKAEQIRTEATLAARELIQRTKADAGQQQTQLDADEREKTQKALAEAEEKGAALAETITKEMSEAADALCEAAGKKQDAAVAYLLQKVREIA